MTSSSIFRSWASGRSWDRLLAHLAERRDLAVLEVGLGEDLAVHLDEDLLDDFGARSTSAGGAGSEGAEQRAAVFGFHGLIQADLQVALNLLFQSIHFTFSLEQLAQQPPTRSNTPPGARGSSLAGFRISALVKPGLTSPARARAVHQLGAAALCV